MSVSQIPSAGGAAGIVTLGFAQITANQTPITTEVDITGLSVNISVPAGRRIRISSNTTVFSTVANDGLRIRIYEDGSQIQFGETFVPVSTAPEELTTSVVLTPTAGSHTYKLTAQRRAGTGNMTVAAGSDNPSYILVEDITGGASIPVTFQDWQPYTPINTNITVGDGTQTARFARVGNTIHWRYRLLWGSTTSFGGTIRVGLPVTAASSNNLVVGTADLVDSGTRFFVGNAVANVDAVSAQIHHSEAGDAGRVNATNPFTWVSGDTLAISGSYEAA